MFIHIIVQFTVSSSLLDNLFLRLPKNCRGLCPSLGFRLATFVTLVNGYDAWLLTLRSRIQFLGYTKNQSARPLPQSTTMKKLGFKTGGWPQLSSLYDSGWRAYPSSPKNSTLLYCTIYFHYSSIH